MKIESGVDLIEVGRIQEAIDKWQDRFLERIFTEDELQYARGKNAFYQHLAARFATKEAVLKAFGDNHKRYIRWREVEVTNQVNGKPEVKLHGYLKELMRRKQITHITVSISHSREYAVANCIIMKNG